MAEIPKKISVDVEVSLHFKMREPFVVEALSARMRPNGAGHNIEFLSPTGQVRGVRPATPFEVSMWNLLCTNDSDWTSPHSTQEAS